MKPIIREILQIVVVALILYFILHSMIQTFRIDGRSMEPNLQNGQYILVNKTAYWFGRDPQRGDIIVLHAPENDASVDRIKRVIGLPDETVEVRRDGSDYTVYIDGYPIEEPYLPSELGGPTGTWIVPPGHYFVMGDNRRDSYDSRGWGTLPRDHIVGKAWIIFWPIGDWGTAPNYRVTVDTTSP
jgi:signal peptidase I